MQQTSQSTLQRHFGDLRPTRWVTRERPKIDRIACPWLIRRFVDPQALILYVPASEVLATAKREQAVAFDLPGATFTHEGEQCTFDALIGAFGLGEDPALALLARIVRGADTDRHDLAPEAAGLHAVSLGLSLITPDDRRLMAHGMVLYDALYAWAGRSGRERHGWRPEEMI